MINMYDVGLMPSFCAAFNKMAGNPYMETTGNNKRTVPRSSKIVRIAGESLNQH